ncbi:GTPase Era [Dissulfurirhabdus thermomarina]|uniref:GTPase Era n=1 Tax=Dissulfurirhabdus thermomarina TaxID=1765737 RepID=A0A6N9TKV5_DISTH|nr:GTPase Era [Dissulfurirhabdus thermomarina]NDY41749.1 GTPase Era [Dissulfurirhabdus thermomarina]NMX24040.1 GTPase Era [Dissulfurirhabdus thermomarina]
MDDPAREGPERTAAGSRPGHRSGVVAIVGAPNVGKSTLLNQFLGAKVAITTPKPQTTRGQIRGILTGENFQVVFVDTPGIHDSKRLLNRVLVQWATRALHDVDVVVFVVDVSHRDRARELAILDLLREVGCPVVAVLNKIDKVAKENLLPILDELGRLHPFAALVPVAARDGDGVEAVLDEILRLLPEGPPYYDAETLTDQGPAQLAAEIIREKVFLLAGQEVPYSTAVEVEDIADEPETGLRRVTATIYVERPSQKGILIGKGGRFIKKVGRMAREEMEELWRRKVYLDLRVKVLKDWSRDEKALRRLGLARQE